MAGYPPSKDVAKTFFIATVAGAIMFIGAVIAFIL
jgi:hypothetical protein